MINNSNNMNSSNISENINAMDNSNTFSISNATTTLESPEREPEAIGRVYKAAARTLREYHGVPSMTAIDLQKTLSLLQLHPRRLVVQGLAPSRLLRVDSSSSLLVKESFGEAKGEECERVVAEKRLRDDDHDSFDMDYYSENETDTKTHEEGGDKTSEDSESDKDASSTKNQSKGKANRPVHTALLAGGVHLRPRETAPLLRALGVSPHRLVRLGLVERGALHALSGGKGHGPHKHRREGRRRAGGMGGPHGPPCHGSPDGPPHAPLGRGPPCGGTHGRRGPPRRGQAYFGDFGEQPHGESGGEEEKIPMHGPSGPSHGPDRHWTRHHGGGKVGKAHGLPHRPPGLHAPGRGSMHRGPGRFGEHSHDEESGGGEIIPMHKGPPGPPQGRGHHGHRDSPIGHRHGPMHGRRGPRGSMHAPRGSPPLPPPRDHDLVGTTCCAVGGSMHAPRGYPPPPPPHDHDLVGTTCCAVEEAMLAPLHPGHDGTRTMGGEGEMPPHGPFHGLFHEGAAHAPHGRVGRGGRYPEQHHQQEAR